MTKANNKSTSTTKDTLLVKESEIEDLGEEIAIKLTYYELTLRSTKSKVYIDFTDSKRNTTTDADISSSYIPDEPLRQLKIYNDGTADFIRYAINESLGSAPTIKLKFGENVEIPFKNMAPNYKINTLTIQAFTSNSDVRIIGIV